MLGNLFYVCYFSHMVQLHSCFLTKNRCFGEPHFWLTRTVAEGIFCDRTLRPISYLLSMRGFVHELYHKTYFFIIIKQLQKNYVSLEDVLKGFSSPNWLTSGIVYHQDCPLASWTNSSSVSFLLQCVVSFKFPCPPALSWGEFEFDLVFAGLQTSFLLLPGFGWEKLRLAQFSFTSSLGSSRGNVLVGYDDNDWSSEERARPRVHMALSNFRPYGLSLADSWLIHQILVR